MEFEKTEIVENTKDTFENEISGSETDVSDEKTDVPSKESGDSIQDAVENGLPRIIVSNAEAKPGDTVFVTATLVNNPGVLGMSVTLSYEESALELVDVECGEAFAETLTLSHSKTLGNGCVFLWDGENILEEQVLDGSILNLQFKILENAMTGKYPIMLICSEGGTIDNNLEVVDIGVVKGFIAVQE